MRTKEKVTEIELPYKFTDEEINQLGRDLAEMNEEYSSIEEEKKRYAQEYKTKLDNLQGKIDNVSKMIIDGEIQRMTKCIVKLNDPVVGKKTLYRQDTGEVAAIQPMHESELQLSIMD